MRRIGLMDVGISIAVWIFLTRKILDLSPGFIHQK